MRRVKKENKASSKRGIGMWIIPPFSLCELFKERQNLDTPGPRFSIHSESEIWLSNPAVMK